MKKYNRRYLVEDAASSNRSRARRYMRDNSEMSKDESMQLDHQLQTQFKNVGKCKCKFLLGLTRMYMNGELEDNSTAQAVNQALGIATEEPYASKLDYDLNGMTAQQFIDTFKDKVEAAGDADKDNLSNQDFGGNNGYDIVLIDSFEKAEKYSAYTTWCVTQSDEAFENYTNGGVFYFCLKSGFENVPMEEGDNTPLDEYGLSMIAVSIYPDGQCNTITCRWNHSNGGNDNVMTTEELSKVIGENFYDVFKPKKRRLTLGGKDYVVGVTESGYKALYDEQGNNVLGDYVEEYELDGNMSKFFGCDVLYVYKVSFVNYVTFQDGKVQYLFEDGVEDFSFDKELSEQLGVPTFWVENDGFKNYATFHNGKKEFLFDDWFETCWYVRKLSNQLGETCFEIGVDKKDKYVILKDGIIQDLFDKPIYNSMYDTEISSRLKLPCFKVYDSGKFNYAFLQDDKTIYMFNEWMDRCNYLTYLSSFLGVPCFEVEVGGKHYFTTFQNGKILKLFGNDIDDADYDDVATGYFGAPCFYVEKNGLWNCIKYQGGKMEYMFNKWVKRDDLEATKEEYLRQKYENRTHRLSHLVTETIMKRLCL